MVPASSTALLVDDLLPGQRHCFRLVAVRTQVPSPYTQRACATTTSMAEPTDVAATAVRGLTTLTWKDTSGGTASFEIAANGEVKAKTIPGQTEFQLQLDGGCFQVRAVTASGPVSAFVPPKPGACAIAPPVPPPCPPTAVSTRPGQPFGTSILASWKQVSAAEGPPPCVTPADAVVEVQVETNGARLLVATSKPGDTAVNVPGLAGTMSHVLWLRTTAKTGISEAVRTKTTAQTAAPTSKPAASATQGSSNQTT